MTHRLGGGRFSWLELFKWILAPWIRLVPNPISTAGLRPAEAETYDPAFCLPVSALLNQSQRAHRRLIDGTRGFQAVVLLVRD